MIDFVFSEFNKRGKTEVSRHMDTGTVPTWCTIHISPLQTNCLKIVWFLLWVCKLGVLNNLPTWHYSEMTSIGLCSAPCVMMLILRCSFMALQHAWSFTWYQPQANQRAGNRYCWNDPEFIGTLSTWPGPRFVGTGSHKPVLLWVEEVANQFSSLAHC